MEYCSAESLGIGCKQRPLLGTRFTISSNDNRQTHLQMIQNLPDDDSPHIFSLPSNIDGYAQKNRAEYVITLLRQMKQQKVRFGL